MTFDQSEFEIRCEWGDHGMTNLAAISDVVVIVDVMSFSTCVSVATVRDAVVFPFPSREDSAIEFVGSVGAELAGPRGKARYSLSPASLLSIPPGTKLVLPSPNGSELSMSAGDRPTLAGCLRNARRVAEAAMQHGKTIAVIPAGERWKDDRSLRPAIEDLVGAGAIIRHLVGTRSPEAQTAVDAFLGVERDLLSVLKSCSSGKQLCEMGYESDIALIAELDVDDCAPMLIEGAYRRVG